MKRILKSELSALLLKINETQAVYAPCKSAGQTNYARFTKESTLDIDTLKTVKSVKEAFFPQSETIYTMEVNGKKIKVTQAELQKEDFVVFGVRGCDIKGIEVLDRVFLSNPVDSFYKARRDHGTIVALSCGEPEESCFCTVFGVDPTEPDGDVTTWLKGDYLYFKANTQKGENLISLCGDLLEDTDCGEVEAEKAKIKEILAQLPYTNLSLDSWHGEATNEKFNSELWKELYKPCLGCGTCTFVCPTCQCYDLKDYDTGNGIQKYRCWDSCMYSDFTMMAHGNNRTSQMQRYRQRFMHKLVYFPANNGGMYSCVGCGRCVDKCPASTNIVKVIKAFEKEGK
ncbi:MAG: 4Fe-4S dicluster domain-containing protein [Acutalibacteraceae bacterium]